MLKKNAPYKQQKAHLNLPKVVAYRAPCSYFLEKYSTFPDFTEFSTNIGEFQVF